MTWRSGDWEVACEELGGRLTRVARRGRDLLTAPHLPGGVFTPPDARWGEYETRSVYGYDDCWPSLEVSVWPGRGRTVRDHGELCWLPWTLGEERGTLVGRVADPEGGWSFTRTLSCPEGALRFEFRCTNNGQAPLCMSWAGHALVPPGAVRELSLPDCETVRLEYPPDKSAITGGVPIAARGVWPWLSSLPSGAAVMLVLRNCRSPELSIELDGLRWRLLIEGVARPSLGLWHNLAGYPPEPGLEREELGVEWMLTPECLLEQAAANGSAVVLPPGGELRWTVTWTIEEIP